MQYQVLARKWRPRNFEQLVGQEHVLKALVNGLNQDRLHHAYLFTGTRGVGKTTIARILAKCLNCEEGVSSVPCDACPSCTEINEGRCVDLIEVDAASRTKVEDTRELLDNVQYAPTRCRYKIYLIDEVHMLSNHSFNALLKTLEEPPPHIKFLLATTDPQKLPITILSRCLQFNLKNLAPDRIVEHLRHVLGEEKVPFDDAALWQLGRAADGSMRDALSLADQGIAYGQNELRAEDVTSMLGTIDRARIYRVLDALCNANAQQVLEEVESLAEFSPDYPALLDELISVLHRVSVVQAVPGSLDSNIDASERIEDFAARLSAEDLQLYYQIALIGRRDLPLNPDPRAGLEMVLLRMLAFQPTIGAPSPPKKKQRITQSPDTQPEARQAPPQASPETPETVAQASPAKQIPTEPAPERGQLAVAQKLVAQPETPTQVKEPGPDSKTRVRAKLDLVVDNQPRRRPPEPSPEQSHPPRAGTAPAAALAEPGQKSEQQPKSEPATESKAPAPADVAPVTGSLADIKANQDWIDLVKKLAVRGMTRNILGECVLYSCSDGCLNLLIEPQYIELLTRTHEDRINQALLEYFGQPVKFVVKAQEHGVETPAAWGKRLREEQIAGARKALENDPVVQQLMTRFGARLDEESISARKEDD